VRVPTGNYTNRDPPQRRVANVAGIGKKIKEAAMHAAKDKMSGGKKGKHTGGPESGADKAKRAVKNFLK
jgi:hypothetical protein